VDAVGQTRVAARKKSISLHGPSGDVGDTLIHGDAHMLMRALVNVIDNAIKYSPPCTAIDVRIERIGDAELALHVVDQGIGIPAEALQRLFEPFFQVERGRREDGGVGLGLPFVKAVVERHRGTVEVSSVPGRGTDFVIRLPLYRQSDSGRTGT
jgi:signal transduction histidine kinase